MSFYIGLPTPKNADPCFYTLLRPAFEGTSATIGRKGFRAMGYHETIAMNRCPQRERIESEQQEPSFDSDLEFWDDALREEMENGNDFMFEIQKIMLEF